MKFKSLRVAIVMFFAIEPSRGPRLRVATRLFFRSRSLLSPYLHSSAGPPSWSRGARPHVVLDLPAEFFRSLGQLMRRLQVQPEFGARSKIASETQSGIRGDRALAPQYRADAIGRNAKGGCERVRGHSERREKLLL